MTAEVTLVVPTKNRFVNKRIVKAVPFMGETVDINKLSLKQVEDLQELSKAAGNDEHAIMEHILKSGVAEFESVTSEDFRTMPLDELAGLSNSIMEFTGLQVQNKDNKSPDPKVTA